MMNKKLFPPIRFWFDLNQYPAKKMVLMIFFLLSVVCARAANATWLGYSSDWNDGQNWSTGTPPQTKDVVYIYPQAFYPAISSGSVIIVSQVRILNGARLKVEAGAKLSIEKSKSQGLIMSNGYLENFGEIEVIGSKYEGIYLISGGSIENKGFIKVLDSGREGVIFINSNSSLPITLKNEGDIEVINSKGRGVALIRRCRIENLAGGSIKINNKSLALYLYGQSNLRPEVFNYGTLKLTSEKNLAIYIQNGYVWNRQCGYIGFNAVGGCYNSPGQFRNDGFVLSQVQNAFVSSGVFFNNGVVDSYSGIYNTSPGPGLLMRPISLTQNERTAGPIFVDFSPFTHTVVDNHFYTDASVSTIAGIYDPATKKLEDVSGLPPSNYDWYVEIRDNVNNCSQVLPVQVELLPNPCPNMDPVAPLPAESDVPDDFGQDVKIAFTGQLAVVGAPQDEAGNVASGAVYVYQKINNQWERQARLTAGDPAAGDEFGYSVAVDSSGATIVVGAPGKNAAYIFEQDLPNSTWSQVKKLTPSSTSPGRFGQAVTMSGVLEFGYSGLESNDRYLAVGDPYDAAGGTNSGSVDIWEAVPANPGYSWQFKQNLTAGTPVAGDEFGYAVDMNTFVGYLLVGAPGRSSGGVNSGTALAFYRDLSWSLLQEFGPAVPVSGSRFGTSVDLSDGYLNAVVGAPLDESAATNGPNFISGAAHVFFFNFGLNAYGSGYKIVPDQPMTGDNIGTAVAINYDGDQILFGAPGDDDNGQEAGAAYNYEWDGAAWQRKGKILACTGAAGDLFGTSLDFQSYAAPAVLHTGIIGAPRNDFHGLGMTGAAFFIDQQVPLLYTVPFPQNELLPETRVTKISLDRTSLFPNPTRADLTLTFPADWGDRVSIRISDATGRPVYHREYIDPYETFTVPAGNFSPGIYLLTIWDEHGLRETRRFVRQ